MRKAHLCSLHVKIPKSVAISAVKVAYGKIARQTMEILMKFLKSIFGSVVEKNYEEDSQRLLAQYRALGPRETATLAASTKLAKAFLLLDHEFDKDESIFLALELMDNGMSPTNEQKGMLSIYNLRIMNLQNQAAKSSNTVNNLVASGIPIWLLSTRAVMNVAVMPQARQAWGILDAADSIYEQSILDQIIHHLKSHPMATMIERVRYQGAPLVFKPM